MSGNISTGILKKIIFFYPKFPKLLVTYPLIWRGGVKKNVTSNNPARKVCSLIKTLI